MIYTFDSKESGESIAFSFDIVNELALPLELINSVTAAVTVKSGTDPSPSSMLSGVATFDGTRVTQVLNGGVNGNYYYLTFTIVTTFQTIKVTGIVPVGV